MAISLEDHVTASGKYPERLNDPELTDQVKANINKLLPIINAFLSDLGITNPVVSSGFRPSSVNAALPNSAKRSLHMIGLAIDIHDADGSLDALVGDNDDLLKQYGVWQESPTSTPGWCHLDIKDRGTRAKNQFIP